MSEDGDPIDWTVDEVVSFLCHNPQTPWSSSTVSNRPDPVSLEASLRENLITGEVLLHDIDLKNLHEDLGIKAFGHRSSVFRAIQYLRKRSLKYQITQEEPNRPHDGSPLSTSRVGTPQREHIASPHIRIRSTAGPNALKGKRPVEYPLQERTGNSRPDEDADSNSENHKATGKPFENRPQESIIVDGQGRKRRRLELLPQVQESGDKKIISKSTDGAQPKEWYMGPEKFQTAQLFYPNTEEDDQSFVMLGPKFPTAQRSFVNKSLNYFYKQQPIKLHSKNGKDQWALMPYRTSDDDKERYFTLYTSKNGRVTVSQQNMNKWPQFSKSQAPVEALSSSDPFAYLIQKYPAVEDSADEIYPLYGESGSEGEYDESTWEEIDDEQQDPGYGKPTKLSRAQVETVMNDCVVEYQKKWHEDKQPKEEQGARKLWLKAKRSRSTNTQIKLFMHEIQLQERRLRKVQDTIRGNDYFAKSELNLICQSMESPIFKIMKEKWRISVLEREECPPRIASTPEPRPKPKSRPTNDDEESLSSDSDESRDDDFINDSDVEVEVGSNHDFSTTRSPSNVSEDDIVSPYREKQKLRTKRPNPLSLRSPSPEGFNNKPSSPDGPTNEPNMDLIDLTMDTPPPDDLTIETPPLNPVPPKNLQHSSTKVPKSEMSSVSPGPELGSRISVEIPKPKQEHIKSANHDLPRINDFGALAQTDWRRIEERSDRGRLLAKLIGSLPDEERAAMADSIPTYGVIRLKHHIRDALNALSRSARQVPGLSSSKNQLVMRTASLYISYVNCVHLSQGGISRHQIVNAQMDLSGFTSFFDVICKHLGAYVDWEQSQEAPGNNSTPHKKRKKEVKESRHTKLNHQNAQERVLNQEKQKEKLQKTWENMGISNDDAKHQVVSFGDPVIYLDSHNGARVKPHQLRGIQFLWRELIEDENQQGCLLAHTMGLGKTMQVISFLATVSAAVSSNNKRIRRQIPQHLHRSQTLVLCPSSLIDNWYEEFLMWTPQSQQRPRSLRKITSSIDFDKRLQTVRDWNTEGGVLIMSYDIFRTWILNKETKVKGRQPADQPADQESHQDNLQEEARGRKCLPKEKHEQVKDWLLKGPSIIVADEAHKMKNSNTGIYQAAVQFQSKSRIALTGSPLANNLIDYYTMVNWIADGYLGEYKQFKANYVEPIEEGLYTDSTHAERRKSLVKLQVLKEILEPKVNRADISALAGSLPPKIEFVMTIPLTKLQTEAYNLYVNSVFDGLGDVRNPKLWSWLAILGLCCNHPKCFWDKLNSRTNETQMPAQEREYSSPGEEPIDQVGLPDSASLVSRQKPLFAVPDLKDLNLSYRTLMLDKIISESVKVGDKILVFSHSLPTLNYIEDVLRSSNRRYCRLDGRTPMGSRQSATKAFNKPGADQVYLISTRAGGLGLNIPGANRVVIFDFQFNPVWEEQAVGRVYRLGQQKPVFVYRFISGGTYEEKVFGKAIFKTHLANRVVDKKNPVRWASKSIGEYLRPAGSVHQKDLTEFIGKDPHVLDKIIANDNGPEKIIRKITLTETLQREDNDNLTEEEKKGVEMHLSDERLKRTDPQAYHELIMRREADMTKTLVEQSLYMHPPAQPVYSSQVYPRHVSHNVEPHPLPPDMSVSGPTASANVGGYPSSTAGSYSLSGTSFFQPVISTSRISPPAGGPPPHSTSQAVTTAPAESNLTTGQSNYTTNPHHEVLSPESQDYESAAEEVTKSPQQNPKFPTKDRSASGCKTQ